MEAKKVAEISGISRNSVNKIFKEIRVKIAEFCEQENLLGCGEIDEFILGQKGSADCVAEVAEALLARFLFLERSKETAKFMRK